MRQEGLSGRDVLGLLLGFFGLVLVVNVYFIYSALATNTGVVAVEPYRKGLAYNERIAASERQDRLGWRADAAVAPDGHVTVTMRDAVGKPVDGRRVLVAIGRPATERFDRKLALNETGPGNYSVLTDPLAAGAWIAEVAVYEASDPDPVFRIRRRLWLKPSL